MKKYILLLMIVLLSACSNDNLEQQEQSVNERQEADTEEIESKGNPSPNTPTENTSEEDSENFSQETEQMITYFIEDMYIESSLEDYRNVEDIVSEDFYEKIKTQFSETGSEENTLEVDRTVGKKSIDIYRSTSNRSDEYVYILDLEIINHDTEDISKTQHIGKVEMIEESENLKINHIEELSNKEIN